MSPRVPRTKRQSPKEKADGGKASIPLEHTLDRASLRRIYKIIVKDEDVESKRIAQWFEASYIVQIEGIEPESALQAEGHE